VKARRQAVEVAGTGPWRVAIVADTHGKPHPATGAHLAQRRPHLILHGGDIGSGEVLEALARHAPTIAVRGNIDAPTSGIPEAVVLDCVQRGRLLLRIFLTHIAVAGPRLRADVGRQARAAGAGLVVCGHSHLPFLGRDGELLVFNPGSIGPRRFQLPITFGQLTLDGDSARLEHVDCETNRPWLPPPGPAAT
jgi:putative phosphoesterase